MNIRKLFSRQTLAVLIAATCLLMSMQVGASIKRSLSGEGGSSRHGHGYDSGNYFLGDHLPSKVLKHMYSKSNGSGHHSRGSGYKSRGKDHYKNKGLGVGWKSLSMTLGKRGHSSPVFASGGKGYPQSHVRHPLVTRLHYDGSSGLTFETWHKDPHTHKWYDIDDDDKRDEHDEKHSQIPEPAGILLLSLGLIGISVTRFRRKCVSRYYQC